MAVKRKTRPYGNGKSSRKGFGREGAEIKDDGDDKMGTCYTRRDPKSDPRKDVKRKAGEEGTLGGSNSQLSQA